ncbi:MAG TPA: polysaccharide biosynthesis tyrosine autokinase [Candidatus Binatia bacterium]|nr:polysaccharide biosynthesis tyrosine autokinase [Candidatus Binatia bacterium]
MEYWKLLKRVTVGVLRRRKRLLVLVTVLAAAAFVPAGYYLGSEPPRFRTSATILIESRPDRVPVFQEFAPFRPLAVQLAILRSRALAENVLDNLPKASVQDLIDNPYHVDYTLTLMNFLRRLRGEEPEVESPQRRALRELQQARVRFDAPGTSGLVTITAEASRPQVAVDIANTYIEALLARTRSFNVDDARVSREFLEQQLAEVKKSLRDSEEALRALTAASGGIRIPDRHQATVSRLTQIEQTLAEVQANRRMVETRLAALREKVEQQKKNPPPPAPAPVQPVETPPDVRRLRQQLAQLEGTLLDLQTRYTEEHPRVVLVKERIAEVQRLLGAAVRETTPVTPAPGAVPPQERVNFAEQVLTLETALHTLGAQEEALRKQADGLRASLQGLSRGEAEYARRVREVESQRALHNMLADKLTAARIREQGEMRVVKVIDPPAPPMPAASTKRLKFMTVALALGLMVGAAVPAGVELVLRTVEGEDDVTATTGLPVLALLPALRSRKPRYVGALPPLRKKPDDNLLFSDCFRDLRVAIQLAQRTAGFRSLLVTSPSPGEGKSTVVVNLGLAFAESGKRVLLADTDFQRPTLHQILQAQPETGIVDVLEGGGADQALVPVGERMWLAPRGKAMRPEVRGTLATARLRQVVQDLGEHAELVIYDSSPVLIVPENLFLAAAVDVVLLVVRAGHTTCRDLGRARELLETAGAKILGVVINEMPVSVLRSRYAYYYRTYGRN